MDVNAFFDELEKLFKQEKNEEAFKLVKKFSKGREDTIAKILLDEGISYDWAKEPHLALNYFELSEKIAKNKELKKLISQNTAIAHNNFGVLLKDLKRYEEAEKEYREAIRIDPEYAIAHYNLGVLLKDLKRYKEAEKEWREAIRIDPEYAEAHNNLGNLLFELKRYKEAEKEYREAIRINPEYAEAHNNLGVLLKDLKRYKEAEKEWREAIKINPDLAEAHDNFGNLLYNLKRYEEAEKEYKKAIKINSEDAEAHANYGLLLFSGLGDYQKAISELEKAGELFLKEGRNYDSKKMNGYRLWSESIILLKKNPEKSTEKYLESSKMFKEIGNEDLAEYLKTCSDFIPLDLKFKNLLFLETSRMKNEMNKLMKDVKRIEFKSDNPDTEIFTAKISCFQILNEIFQKMHEITPGKKLNLDYLRERLKFPEEIFRRWNLTEEVEHLKTFERIIDFVENYGLKSEDELMENIRELAIYDGVATSNSQRIIAEKYSVPYISIVTEIIRTEISSKFEDLKSHIDRRTLEIRKDIELISVKIDNLQNPEVYLKEITEIVKEMKNDLSKAQQENEKLNEIKRTVDEILYNVDQPLETKAKLKNSIELLYGVIPIYKVGVETETDIPRIIVKSIEKLRNIIEKIKGESI